MKSECKIEYTKNGDFDQIDGVFEFKGGAEGPSLLEVFQENQIYIKSSCGGHASCSECIVKVLSGKENLNELTTGEKKLLGNVFHITKERLSCQAKILDGSVKIDLSIHDRDRDQDRKTAKDSKFAKKKIKISGPVRPSFFDKSEKNASSLSSKVREKKIE